MATPTTTNNLPLVLGPYAATYFDGLYDGAESEYEQIVTKKTGFESDQYLSTVIYGFPAAPKKNEGANIEYQTFGELFHIAVRFNEYALAFALTQAAVEDGKSIELTELGVKHLVKSLEETKNIEAANILNRGFNGSYPIGDGQPLFSASHPGKGATYNNLITGNGALSQSTLEGAVTNIISALDPTGKQAALEAAELVVPTALWAQASTILGSTGRTGTTNNDANPLLIYGSMKSSPAVLRRLTSSTAWFVKTKGGDTETIVHAERAPMDIADEKDFNTGSYRFKVRERYIMLAENPLGMFGSTGVGS